MNNPRTNIVTQKISRVTSAQNNNISNPKISKHFQKSNVVPPRKARKEQNITSDKRKIKMDYNSSNYFYDDNNENIEDNEEEVYEEYQYDNNHKVEYYDKSHKEGKYNHETSDSYITVEQEDGSTKKVPKKYVENNRRNQPYMYKDENDNYDYYEENSEDSGNGYDQGEMDNGNDEGEIYYENENENEEYEQDMIEQQSPKKNYNQYQSSNKYYISQNNKNSKKTNKNVISRPINHQINYQNESKRKGRTPAGMHNYGNNTTTTNNTYNNNIYYINPINMKNKNKKEEGQKLKKVNSKKNSVYKNVGLTLNKNKINKERDYFKINNIDKSERNKYIKAAILIQSIFRAYLVKVKVFNNLTLCISCKKIINILENSLLKSKKYFWKSFKDYDLYDALFNSKLSLNILKQYLRNNNIKNNLTEKKNFDFHKELGDSFKIVNENDNSEIKLKSKLNDMIKENTELKSQLVDSKNVEEKMKNLIDENKKNQNINAIIMKDNQQLAKKLKDFQDYRNTNLIVENQPALDLNQKELIEIDELIKKSDWYKAQLKEILLRKIFDKKTNEYKFMMKYKFDEFKERIKKIKNNDEEINLKKKIHIKNLIYIIENRLKLIKSKCFRDIYYKSIITNNQSKSKNNLRSEILKNIFVKKEQNRKSILLKSFIKIYYNKFQPTLDSPILDEEEIRNLKIKLLSKFVKKYDYNRRLLLKIFIEKWCLLSKILGIRAAARDKKKKRKQKKKENKLYSQKHYKLDNLKQKNDFMTPIYSKSNHEFSYIVSHGAIIKESSSNEATRINMKNNKCSISSDKVNKLNNKLEKSDGGIKKINSVNEIIFKNNIKKESSKNDDTKENINSNNEESEEDSGDSLGLGNNSD